jgi:hypothetical protein
MAKRNAGAGPEASPRLLPEQWAADLISAFERELAEAQSRSIYVIRVKVDEFPSGADMLKRPRGEWLKLVVAVFARLDELRNDARRKRVGNDDFAVTYNRELDALKLLADRLLRPRLSFDQAQFATILDIAVENLRVLAQQGRALGWNWVVPRTLLVQQADHLVGAGPAREPLAGALKHLRNALRDPALKQRIQELRDRS